MQQLNLAGLQRLFALTDRLQPVARRQKVCQILEGAQLACIFFEASTRTRLSFAAAFNRLGGAVMGTTGFTFSSMAKGESLADTSRVLAGYSDVIVVRHPEEGAVAEFAAASCVPVVNGGDGPGEHPSQALLDVYTIESEFKRLNKTVDGSSITLQGDLRYGRTVHSLARLLALYRGLRFKLFAVPGLELPFELEKFLLEQGHRVEKVETLEGALSGTDVVYATRVQRERIPDGDNASFSTQLQIDRSAVQRYCTSDTLILHPLPRDSRPGAYDLAQDLNGDPRLAIFRQADNGVALRMAIFTELLGVSNLLDGALRPALWWSPSRYGPDDTRDRTEY